MLALPVVTGVYGLASATITLTSVWFINVLIALCLLEANLRSPEKTNLITMARITLGPVGEYIAWGSCLLFLYAILVAYCSGLHELLNTTIKQSYQTSIPSWIDTTIIIGFFSILIYAGTQFVDYVNRFLMTCLGISFVLLIYHVIPFIHINHSENALHNPMLALPIVFTSFGYLIVIPTIRSYLHSDVKKIRLSILIGSFIPLLMYLSWVTSILGIIPIGGTQGLQQILHSGDPGTGITQAISTITSDQLLSNIARTFVFFAVSTSFVGVSLGLYDFLSDGLNIHKHGKGKILLTALTFLPPLLFTIIFKNLFISALGYAALFSAIIFGAYPTLMAWSGRKVLNQDTYRLAGGQLGLLFILIFSMLIFFIEALKISHMI